MHLDPESAWEELERRIALAEIAGPLSLGPDTLARLSAIGRRTKYPPGATIADRDQIVTSMPLVLSGDLRIERAGATWRAPEQGNPLMLLWLARDPQKRHVVTEGGAEVIELPVDGLEAIIEDDLWTPVAGRLAERILELPSVIVRPDARPGHDLGDRLGALMRAMPFASRYIDALLQLDDDADLVRIETTPWKPDEIVTTLFIPLDAGVPQLERDQLAGLGAIELLAGRPRVAELPAHGPYDAIRIDQEALFDVLEDHPDLARDLLAALAAHAVRRMEGQAGGAS